MSVSVQAAPFDPGAELAAFGTPPGCGAVASFTGHVRGDGDLVALEIEHWEGVTEAALDALAAEARARWPLGALRVIHRHGRLRPGEPIVMVLAASPHRDAAFEAARYLMDALKSRAPFWKKEVRADGGAWVEAREADAAALAAWAR